MASRIAPTSGLTWAAAGIAAVALAWPCARAARGDDSTLDLSWTAPAECPSQEDVRADVARRLGGSMAGKPVTAHAKVARTSDGVWQVVLTTEQQGARGRRQLHGATCAAVTSALALILALTIDPQAVAREATKSADSVSPPSPPPSAPPTTPPAPAPEESPPPAASIPARTSANGEMEPSPTCRGGVAPTLGFGLTGVPVFGLTIDAALFVARATSLEISGALFLPASHDSSGHAGKGGTFTSLGVGTSACNAPFGRARLQGGACAGIEYQRLWAAGYGVTKPGSAVADWTAPTLSPFLDVGLTSTLWLTMRLQAGVPLLRPDFVLTRVGDVYRVAPVFLRASLGVEIRF